MFVLFPSTLKQFEVHSSNRKNHHYPWSLSALSRKHFYFFKTTFLDTAVHYSHPLHNNNVKCLIYACFEERKRWRLIFRLFNWNWTLSPIDALNTKYKFIFHLGVFLGVRVFIAWVLYYAKNVSSWHWAGLFESRLTLTHGLKITRFSMHKTVFHCLHCV